MTVQNLDIWVPNPLAFGAVQSSGPFTTKLQAIDEGIPTRPNEKFDFFNQISIATIDSYIVLNSPPPFDISLNGETFTFDSIVEGYLGTITDRYSQIYYALWKYSNGEYFVSGPSNSLANFEYQDGYCVFNPDDIPTIEKSNIIRFNFDDFAGFIYNNIFPTFQQYKNASLNGSHATYINNLNNLCDAWLPAFTSQRGVNPSTFSPLAADFVDMLMQMWQAHSSFGNSGYYQIIEHSMGKNMTEFKQMYNTLYTEWSLTTANDKELAKRVILKYYNPQKYEYLIKSITNVVENKFTIKEVESDEYICLNEVNGEWITGDIVKEIIYDIASHQWGLGNVSREIGLSLGMLDLLKVIKKEPRLLGGDMAAIFGSNEEPEGEGFGSGGDTIGQKDWPQFRFGAGFTYSPKRYEIWEISEGLFAIRFFEDKDSDSYIVLEQTFNNLEEAKTKARTLVDEVFKGEIEQKDKFQSPSIFYQRKTSDDKFFYNLVCTGVLQFGVNLSIQRQALFANTYPETIEFVKLEVDEIRDANSLTAASKAKENLDEKLLEKWRNKLDKYVGEYNSEAGQNGEDFDTFFGEMTGFFEMLAFSYDFSKDAVKNVLLGSVLGLAIAAPFLVIIWGAYFLILMAQKVGGF